MRPWVRTALGLLLVWAYTPWQAALLFVSHECFRNHAAWLPLPRDKVKPWVCKARRAADFVRFAFVGILVRVFICRLCVLVDFLHDGFFDMALGYGTPRPQVLKLSV